MKNGPRMTKQSKLRKITKRQLPKRLRKHGSAAHAAAIEAKRPHEPRSMQRMKKIKFRELQRRHDSQLGKIVEAMAPPSVVVPIVEAAA